MESRPGQSVDTRRNQAPDGWAARRGGGRSRHVRSLLFPPPSPRCSAATISVWLPHSFVCIPNNLEYYSVCGESRCGRSGSLATLDLLGPFDLPLISLLISPLISLPFTLLARGR